MARTIKTHTDTQATIESAAWRNADGIELGTDEINIVFADGRTLVVSLLTNPDQVATFGHVWLHAADSTITDSIAIYGRRD